MCLSKLAFKKREASSLLLWDFYNRLIFTFLIFPIYSLHSIFLLQPTASDLCFQGKSTSEKEINEYLRQMLI